MSDHIPNSALTEDLLPSSKADWPTLQRFALSFDGYVQWGSFEKCAELAKESSTSYRENGALPSTLTALRTCLFFEQRRWRHYGYDPGEEDMVYLAALMDGIRSKVKAGQIE